MAELRHVEVKQGHSFDGIFLNPTQVTIAGYQAALWDEILFHDIFLLSISPGKLRSRLVCNPFGLALYFLET